MSIEFRCQACQRLLHTPDYAAGGHARCPECGAAVPVPLASTSPVARGDDAGAARQDDSRWSPVPPSLSVLDPNAQALRETPSKHAADTDYPVRKSDRTSDGENTSPEAPRFETTHAAERPKPGMIERAADAVTEAIAAATAEVEQEGAKLHDQQPSADAPVVSAQFPAVNPRSASPVSQSLSTIQVSPTAQTGVAPTDVAEHCCVEIGDILGAAWKSMTGNLFSSIAVGVVSKLIFAGGVVAVVFSMIGLVELIDTGGDEDALIGAVGIVTVFGALFLLVSWLLSGVCLYASNVSRGQPSSFLDLFRGERYMYRMWIATLLCLPAIAIGLAFFLVPGIVIFLRLCLYPFFIVDRDMGSMAALRESHRVTGQQLGKMALTLLIAWAIWLVISGTGVGVFVATPLVIWILAALYFRLCNERPASDGHPVPV
ncbi:MAG: hypothetical protein MPJ50_11555 [Pirellulales bacterium]|nr:hypothetical protein [Pirellulales bacterium]